MNWFLSILIAILTGIGGIAGGLFLGTLNVRWYRISSFEGGSGYYVIALGLAGGVVGLITGIVASRLVAHGANPSFLKGLGMSLGAFVALAGAVTGLCWVGADVSPTIEGRRLKLVAEIRAPRKFNPEFPRDQYGSRAYLEKASGKTVDSEEIPLQGARREGDRWVYSVTLDLATRSSGKRLRAYFNKDLDPFFALGLRGSPRKSDLEWSPWVDAMTNVGFGRMADGEPFQARYRVELYPEVKPEPAAPAPDPVAEVDDIDDDAPIGELLVYTGLEHSDTVRQAALRRLQERPHFAGEVSALISTADIDEVSQALRAVAQLEEFPIEVKESVAYAAQRIVGWRKAWMAAQTTPNPAAPDEYDVSACVRNWLAAVSQIRAKAEGDFTKEFAEVTKDSREQDLPALREWGGFPAQP